MGKRMDTLCRVQIYRARDALTTRKMKIYRARGALTKKMRRTSFVAEGTGDRDCIAAEAASPSPRALGSSAGPSGPHGCCLDVAAGGVTSHGTL